MTRIAFALILFALVLADRAFAETPAAIDYFGGRDALVYAPTTLPAKGTRALVIVLHGAFGNAASIERVPGDEGAMRMDAFADANGFVVAYLNGSPISLIGDSTQLAWNSGGCCGIPARTDTDDVAYVTSATAHLIAEYGIDPKRVFVMGHSNGAMMAMRLMCETTVFAGAVSIAGPLNIPVATCPNASGRRILSIHGALDGTIPIEGGHGPRSVTDVDFVSEEKTKQIMVASGADFHLDIVADANHGVSDIDEKLKASDGRSLAETATHFFGLAP